MGKLTVPDPKAQYPTLKLEAADRLLLSRGVQMTALVETFKGNDHANLAEISCRESIYAETVLYFIPCLRSRDGARL
jgi:hypothetical protein